MIETFIVGTGRCGSTLLSDMLRLHPDVLVLSEFMKGFDPWLWFDGESRSGEFFAELLAAPNFTIDVPLRRGFVPPEILHGLQGVDLHTISLPKLFVATLPTLTDEPEKLLAESIALARTFPTQPMADHFRTYIAWLQQRFGKRRWAERSGASIEIMPELRRMFPDARFVHIHRDGPEAALSMREHAYFRLYVSLFFDPPTRAELERTELGGKPIGADDPFTQRMTTRLPAIARFGEFWSQQIAVGFHEFQYLAPSRLLHVRFEDVVENTAATLSSIAAFLELPENPSWIGRAAGMVHPGMSARRAALPEGERLALECACRPGQLLLGRAAWQGIDRAMELMQQVSRSGGDS